MEFLSDIGLFVERLANSRLMHRALLGGSLIACVAPLLGVFLVLRRYALFAEGLGHTIFGGIGIAFFLETNPVWSSLITAIASGLGIEKLRTQKRFSRDMAIAIFLTIGLGAGIFFSRLAGETSGSINNYLFGSLALVGDDDLWLAGIIVAIVLVSLIFIGKELFAIIFDEESAQAGGISAPLLNYVLTILAALVIVGSMRITGVLLASAIVILPTAASLQIARSFKSSLIWAVVFGLLMVNIGLIAHYAAGNWSPSGTVVMTGAVLFGITWLIDSIRRVLRQRSS
jgi:zinc transport system permease protein